MFPKIQKSRQERWPRFWRRAQAWAWANHSHCAFPLLDQSCWERCEESSQTAFIQPPDPTLCIPLIEQPSGLRGILHIPPVTSWHSSPCMIFPLFNGFPYYSCQNYSSTSPLLSIISDFVAPHPHLSSHSQWSLRLLCGDLLASEHLEKLNKLGNPANASYWFTL